MQPCTAMRCQLTGLFTRWGTWWLRSSRYLGLGRRTYGSRSGCSGTLSVIAAVEHKLSVHETPSDGKPHVLATLSRRQAGLP